MPGVSFKVVIPARYASTRLPAKPLLDLGGKPMVVRVAERARLSGAEEIWVATDHSEVRAAAAALADQAVGSRVVLGASLLANATTRRLGELGLRTGTRLMEAKRTLMSFAA